MNWDQLKDVGSLVGWVAAFIALLGALVALYSARLAARSARQTALEQSNRGVRRPVYDDFLDRVDELVYAVDWESHLRRSRLVSVAIVRGADGPAPDAPHFRESHWRHRGICELVEEARGSARSIEREGSAHAIRLANQIIRVASGVVVGTETDRDSGEEYALLSTLAILEDDDAYRLRQLRDLFKETRRHELFGE